MKSSAFRFMFLFCKLAGNVCPGVVDVSGLVVMPDPSAMTLAPMQKSDWVICAEASLARRRAKSARLAKTWGDGGLGTVGAVAALTLISCMLGLGDDARERGIIDPLAKQRIVFAGVGEE